MRQTKNNQFIRFFNLENSEHTIFQHLNCSLYSNSSNLIQLNAYMEIDMLQYTIPSEFFTSFKGTEKPDCIFQLKLCGIALRSILENIDILLRVSASGWPVLESIKLSRVCDTYIRTYYFRIIKINVTFGFLKRITLTWTTS